VADKIISPYILCQVPVQIRIQILLKSPGLLQLKTIALDARKINKERKSVRIFFDTGSGASESDSVSESSTKTKLSNVV
jgi:hypothetical protein